jgi:hypothetical protein
MNLGNVSDATGASSTILCCSWYRKLTLDRLEVDLIAYDALLMRIDVTILDVKDLYGHLG